MIGPGLSAEPVMDELAIEPIRSPVTMAASLAVYECVDRDLETRSYLTHPYASRQRGLRKNSGGLIRQYSSKNQDVMPIIDGKIKLTMSKHAQSSRKSLGFRIPYAVFFQTEISLSRAIEFESSL